MGLIGKNGAGKSTTLKSMLNLVHPDEGTIEMFGNNFKQNEESCKQELGVVWWRLWNDDIWVRC
ncbi:ATP-binding cassette domain-containing protein [Pallidibacillus pasinlerensis]|uniref:ATP-binding cassette domain-containing protein n=1 Tax=Pallidibacillus pasinlerensis TaxID=2703818 RepID=A0ABX0A6C9_9BACI|nr:ATP-binding cassette domain-containing protein [Pallidibacillus pasinlerensis]NCU18956.1 ATP-binding cassette domain-containing protein [Pallidibacillus pasinlerensis]